MGSTTYFRIPYPDATTVTGEAWNVTNARAMSTIDTIVHDQQVALLNTTGILGRTEDDVAPYTLVGTGKTWPASDTLFGSFTLSKMVDDWFIALRNLMNGKLAIPVRLPEAAYCNPVAAVRGSTISATMGPVVRLNNDSNRTAYSCSAAYLSNAGGIVPAEPMSSQYPIIFPRSGLAKTLAAFSDTYITNDLNADKVVADEDSVENFTRKETATSTMGTYRPAFFDQTKVTSNDTITVTGSGLGTFRIYGLTGSTVSYVDAVKSIFGGSVTVNTTFDTILGVSFKGTEFTSDLASCDSEYCILTVELKSGVASDPFVSLEAYRPCEYIEVDTFYKPDRKFFASWECYDPGYLQGSANKVAGIPFLMFAIGMRDNKVAFLKENLELQGLSDAEIDLAVNDLMTEGLLDIPSIPKPMYIVGATKSGTTKTWAITPKVVFTTVNNLGYDGNSYHLMNDVYPENYFTQDFNWPEDGIVFNPQPPSLANANNGTVVLYRYEFPTDLADISQILWANADALNQYGKVAGLAVTIPIGRVLAQSAMGYPTSVKLWTQDVLDNAAKFDVLVDMLFGYLAGSTSGSKMATQVEAIGAQLGFSSKDTHALLSALPIAVPMLRYFPIDNLYNKRDIDLQFTVNNYVGSEFGDANLRCEIQNFVNTSSTHVSEMRIYFAVRKELYAEYNKDGSEGTFLDHWSHYYDESFSRSYVVFPFVNGQPVNSELHFKGAGHVFAAVLLFSDGSKFITFPSNGKLYADTDTKYLRNPTTTKYIDSLEPINDGTYHLICIGNLDTSTHTYGDAFTVVLENPEDYKLLITNISTGEYGEWATGSSQPVVDYYNRYGRKDLTLRSDIVSYDSQVKHTNPISDGATTQQFKVQVFRKKENAIIAELDYLPTVGATLDTIPTSIKLYESYLFEFGGLTSLSSLWMLVSVFYFMWLISPSATALIFATSTVGAPTAIRETILGYMKISTNRFDELLEWVRRWIIGEPKEITP